MPPLPYGFCCFVLRQGLSMERWLSLCRPGWPQSQRSACPYLPSAEVKSFHCHVWLDHCFLSVCFLKERYLNKIFWLFKLINKGQTHLKINSKVKFLSYYKRRKARNKGPSSCSSFSDLWSKCQTRDWSHGTFKKMVLLFPYVSDNQITKKTIYRTFECISSYHTVVL